MDIYIAQNGEQAGPFPEQEVRRMITANLASQTDLGWREGLADWAPLSEILGAPALPAQQGLPAQPVSPSPAVDDAEAIRKKYLSHEASVKSVGILYYLSAFFMLFAGVGAVMSAVLGNRSNGHHGNIAAAFGVGLVFLLFTFIFFWIGSGLRKLDPKVKTVATVLAAIGLVGFPVGTLINAYILYLYISEKGRMVFSPEYHAVMAATPEIKYKTSVIVWIFVVLVLVLIGIAVIGAMAAAFTHK